MGKDIVEIADTARRMRILLAEELGTENLKAGNDLRVLPNNEMIAAAVTRATRRANEDSSEKLADLNLDEDAFRAIVTEARNQLIQNLKDGIVQVRINRNPLAEDMREIFETAAR